MVDPFAFTDEGHPDLHSQQTEIQGTGYSFFPCANKERYGQKMGAVPKDSMEIVACKHRCRACQTSFYFISSMIKHQSQSCKC